MKKIKVLSIIVFMIVTILVMQEKSYAGLTVTSGNPTDKVTASAAFAYCYNLRVSNSTLGENKLDPHMMLNSDFAAALYLSTSMYGTGNLAALSSGAYNYINGNRSGIGVLLNTNINDRTAAMLETYSGSSNIEYFTNLVEFADTKYVEILPQDINAESNKGKAFGEITSWGSGSYMYSYPSNSNAPGVARKGFLYYTSSNDAGGGYGVNVGNYFRPVIWN